MVSPSLLAGRTVARMYQLSRERITKAQMHNLSVILFACNTVRVSRDVTHLNISCILDLIDSKLSAEKITKQNRTEFY